jgi:hypothetical protein
MAAITRRCKSSNRSKDLGGGRVEESLDTLGVHSVSVPGFGEPILDRRALAPPERVHHLDRDLFPDPQMRSEVLGRPVAATDRPPASESVLVETCQQARELGVLILEQADGVVASGHARIVAGGEPRAEAGESGEPG